MSTIFGLHLIYIDVTQICHVGCDFCMYKNERKNGNSLILNDLSKKNIKSIINHDNILKTVISGEGEPLNNMGTVFEIFSLSNGNNIFEFITSAYISPKKLNYFFLKIDNILIKNHDFCNIRISIDRYHVSKIHPKSYEYILLAIKNKYFKNLKFSFRSVDTDRLFIRDYINKIINKQKISIVNIIEDVFLDLFIIDENNQISIEYKNLVMPYNVNSKDYMSIYEYVQLKSSKNKRPFTLGNQIESCVKNGLDITIKPNGNIIFYGVDSEIIGNINEQTITLQDIQNFCKNNKLIKFLRSYPMEKLLNNISNNEELRSIVDFSNNPYWIIKNMLQKGVDPYVLLQYND